jgi:hypothetical protein
MASRRSCRLASESLLSEADWQLMPGSGAITSAMSRAVVSIRLATRGLSKSLVLNRPGATSS